VDSQDDQLQSLQENRNRDFQVSTQINDFRSAQDQQLAAGSTHIADQLDRSFTDYYSKNSQLGFSMLETLFTEIHLSVEPKSDSDGSIVPINSYEVIQKALSKVRTDISKFNTQLNNQMQQSLMQNQNLKDIIRNRSEQQSRALQEYFQQLYQTSIAIFSHSIPNWCIQWNSLLLLKKIHLMQVLFDRHD
jgi:leucyl-tRNA synthetase